MSNEVQTVSDGYQTVPDGYQTDQVGKYTGHASYSVLTSNIYIKINVALAVK